MEPTPMVKIVAERVKHLRKKRDLSQEELAHKADINASYISLIENSKRANIGLGIIHSLAVALQTSIGYLIGETNDPKPILLMEQAAHDSSRLHRADQPLAAEDIRDLERVIREATEIIQRAKEGEGGTESD